LLHIGHICQNSWKNALIPSNGFVIGQKVGTFAIIWHFSRMFKGKYKEKIKRETCFSQISRTLNTVRRGKKSSPNFEKNSQKLWNILGHSSNLINTHTKACLGQPQDNSSAHLFPAQRVSHQLTTQFYLYVQNVLFFQNGLAFGGHISWQFSSECMNGRYYRSMCILRSKWFKSCN